jgi:DNA-binding XRE family transcriptional regulator
VRGSVPWQAGSRPFHEDGLSHAQVGRLLGRGSATVITLTREMAEDVHGITRPEIERARAILRDGRASAEAPTRPVSPRSLGGYLVGLTAVQEAAGLSKKELVQHAGLSRETVSRIETLKRPAEPATVRALAAALGVEPIVLVTPCEGQR